jgi:hypothetical protein
MIKVKVAVVEVEAAVELLKVAEWLKAFSYAILKL